MNFIPNDDTGEVIRQLLEMGRKINENISIDFFVAFEKEEDAKKFIDEAFLSEFSLAMDFEEELQCWTVYCTKELLLAYNEIRQIEEKLDNIAKKYNGYADGFSANID